MQGETFRMLGYQTDACFSFPDDTETGEPINDALFRRNLKLKERYNINFTYEKQSDVNNLRDSADRSIAAASDDYDILIANMTPCASGLILKGELLSYDNIPYVDLTQPW